MRNLILVVHIYLDGFVAGPKGELDGFPVGEEKYHTSLQLIATKQFSNGEIALNYVLKTQ